MNKLEVKEKKDEVMEESKDIVPKEYGCEILLENTTLEKANDSSFPYDAYLIWYKNNDKNCLDLTRCYKKSNLFDMYYDKYGPGSIQKIDFGHGKVSPKLWGYKKPEKKKRK
jgi:hypothetical protein